MIRAVRQTHDSHKNSMDRAGVPAAAKDAPAQHLDSDERKRIDRERWMHHVAIDGHFAGALQHRRDI